MYLQDDLLKESVTYQRIIREGRAEGIQQGIQQGIGEGEKEEAIALVSRLIKKRFPERGETIRETLQNLSVEQMESLAESLFDFTSFDDVTNWLQNLNS